MSIRNLTDAECGRVNPISQLTSHLTTDHTFRETHGYNQPFTSEADQLVEQFLQETRAAPQTFQMDSLLQEMREIESQRFVQPPVPASRVKDQLNNDDVWALQYLEDGKKFELPDQEKIWADALSPQNELHELGLGEEWAAHYIESTQHDDGLSDEAREIQKTAREVTDTVKDPKFQYSKFMRFMNQVGDGTVIIEDGKVQGDIADTNETSDIWVQEYSTQNKSDDLLGKDWAEEYKEKIVENTQTNDEIWGKYHDEWSKLSSEDANEHPWISEYTDQYGPYKEYEFTEDNPMSNVPNAFEIGKEKLASGDLPSAVLCFEAAAKQSPENAEIWQYLGTTQAENEQDPLAISALKKCIDLDPSNLTAIMSLAVCYTNESYTNLACQTLANWLQNNPKYRDLVPPDYKYDATAPLFLSQEQHKQVQDMFIKAVHKNPQEIDYEIQCGLGVLFNLSNEYDKAIDCFRTALQVKPDDSRLWNRLGATLANGSRSEEAVDAYHRALELSPGFIRARYNVGITCINLGAYKEAAEHFLIALNQQAKGRDPSNLAGSLSQMSDTIWSTLRMCVGLLNRTELKSLVDSRDLVNLNKEFDITDI